MIKNGYGNYVKLIAFFLVAAVLVCGFGFATEGWWQNADQSLTSGDNAINGNGQNAYMGDINASVDPENTSKEPEIYIPEYVNLLTGEETTEELSRKRHYAFVLDTTSPLYGISSADLTVELPIENGETRLLCFTNNVSNLSKIGSLLPTRSYISNVAKFFNSVIISCGNDGKLNYEKCDMNGSMFDMSAHPGYYYTEYIHFTYTNGDLIDAGVYNANVNTTAQKGASLPYEFIEFGKKTSVSGIEAKSVIIPYSEKSETELYYSASTKTYSLNKNGVVKSDMLSDKKISYKNLFILYADTMTYESQTNTEMVMNTIGKGEGYYITEGYAKKIVWESDLSGNLIFCNENGEKLIIERGNSYIGFTKSSKSQEVKIS